jgi:hypothetical protein
LRRSHTLIVVTPGLALLFVDEGLIGRHLVADIYAAMELFQHQQPTTGDSTITRV